MKQTRQKTRTPTKVRPKAPLGVMGLPEDEDVKPATVVAPKSGKPSFKWEGVRPSDIGSGFKSVDLALFEDPRDTGSRFVSRPFRNKFVTGTSPSVSWSIKPVLIKTRNKVKRQQAFNSNTKVTKNERKSFIKSLSANIADFGDMFTKDLLPVTLAVNTAAEEVKEKTAQLIDEPVPMPLDFMKTKLLQATQMIIIRKICDKMKLNPTERKLMYAEFLPRLPEFMIPQLTRKQK